MNQNDPMTEALMAPHDLDARKSIGATRASAASEMKNAAWIRTMLEFHPPGSGYRAGMIDAHRDSIMCARFNRIIAELRALR